MSKHSESFETQNDGPYEFETRSKLASRVSATGFVAAGLVILGGLVGGGAWAVTAVANPQLAEQVSNFDPNAPLDGGFAIEDPADDSSLGATNDNMVVDPMTVVDPSATDPAVVPPLTFGNGDDDGDDEGDDQGEHHGEHHGSSFNVTDPSAAPTFSSDDDGDDSGDDQSDDESEDSGSDD